MSVLPYVVAAWVMLVGLYGIVTSRNLINLVICLGVAQSSTYVLLLGIGYQKGATAAVFKDIPTSTPTVDPVVAALTLTDVVVAAVVTALLLALVVQLSKRGAPIDPDAVSELQA